MQSKILAALIVLSLATVPLIPGPAGAAAPDSCKPSTTLENDDVKIWFHGKKGFVKVFKKDNATGGNEGMYQYKTEAIVELDGDGNEVARMNLERAFPQTSTCTIVETDQFVNMTLQLTDTVRGAMGGDLGNATVTFAYNFNKTSDGAKFDLYINDWPWQADGTLAFDFDIQSPNYNFDVASNGVGFEDDDGNQTGYIEWAPNATAKYDDGHNETALVVGNTTVTGNTANVRLDFTNVTAGYTELEYDPWAGVGRYIIVLNILIAERSIPLPPVVREPVFDYLIQVF